MGERDDSKLYVKMKKKACDEIGIEYIGVDMPADSTQEEIEEAVTKLNEDEKVNGILVQLPLPGGIDENAVLDLISPKKDVDGLHPKNMSDLLLNGRTPRFTPCTPQGCMKLIHSVREDISGLKAAVLGRSNMVGLPMAILLQQQNATVTTIHSKTLNVE